MAKLFCLMGLPGSGKSSVLYRLYDEFRDELIVLPRITDRSVRKDELPPEANPEYSFKSRQWFAVLEQNGVFAALETLGNYHYAVRRDDLRIVFQDGRPGLLMAGYCGLQIKKKHPQEVYSIFLSVPGVDFKKCIFLPQAEKELKSRMHQRGDSKEKIEERISLARRIIEQDKVHLQADCILVNYFGKLEQTLERMRQILGLEKGARNKKNDFPYKESAIFL